MWTKVAQALVNVFSLSLLANERTRLRKLELENAKMRSTLIAIYKLSQKYGDTEITALSGSALDEVARSL